MVAVSSCKNNDYKKGNIFYMDVLKYNPHQKISNQKMKLTERDKFILEYVHMHDINNVHAYKVPGF